MISIIQITDIIIGIRIDKTYQCYIYYNMLYQ